MSIEKRYKIVPQMVDYDLLGVQWVPYVMRFHRPLRSYPSVSTDENGFRHTIDKDGKSKILFTDFKDREDIMQGALLGSSACFGVGATKNNYTVASILNTITEYRWFNYGGRALNSTQELIVFLLFLPKSIQKLIVFSGVNNLTLSYLSYETSPYYNSFYFQSAFKRAMELPIEDTPSIRKSFLQLVKAIKQRFVQTSVKSIKRSIENQYLNILACFKRDMTILTLLSKAMGFEVYFVMQPLATWIDKDLSNEEEKLFSILDKLTPDFIVLSQYMKANNEVYRNDIKLICKNLKVPFIDLNSISEFTSNRWLFVDRVHLTDEGYNLCANLIKKELML